MPQLRLLTIAFDTEIEPWEVRAFRGAVADKAGVEHEYFHNHNNTEGGYHYRYPLIQYKYDRRRPMIICLNEGVEEMHHFFTRPDWTLEINGQSRPMRIGRLDVKQYAVQVWPREFTYHLRQWMPLNTDNYRTYQRLDGLLARLAFLESLLRNHLVAFCYGIGAEPERPVEARILELKEEKWVRYKDVRVLAFSLTFRANLSLPDFVGLGKGASVGWGVVRKLNSEPPGQTGGRRPGRDTGDHTETETP